jgi:hypothetical protein
MRFTYAALVFAVGMTAFAQDATTSKQQQRGQDAKPIEPYRIKADILGEPMTLYKQNNPNDCLNDDSNPGQHQFAGVFSRWLGTCEVFGQGSSLPVHMTVWMTYAGTTVRHKLATFDKDRFVKLALTVTHSSYTQLHDALIEKFGQPTATESEELQNKMGAHFTGQVLVWNNSLSTIRLVEYAGDVESSSVTFGLNEYLEGQEKLRKAAPKKATSDM